MYLENYDGGRGKAVLKELDLTHRNEFLEALDDEDKRDQLSQEDRNLVEAVRGLDCDEVFKQFLILRAEDTVEISSYDKLFSEKVFEDYLRCMDYAFGISPISTQREYTISEAIRALYHGEIIYLPPEDIDSVAFEFVAELVKRREGGKYIPLESLYPMDSITINKFGMLLSGFGYEKDELAKDYSVINKNFDLWHKLLSTDVPRIMFENYDVPRIIFENCDN